MSLVCSFGETNLSSLVRLGLYLHDDILAIVSVSASYYTLLAFWFLLLPYLTSIPPYISTYNQSWKESPILVPPSALYDVSAK